MNMEQRRRHGSEWDNKDARQDRKQREPDGGYDPSKDKLIEVIGSVPLNRSGSTTMSLELRSYDNRPPRLAIIKVMSDRDPPRRFMFALDHTASVEASKLISQASHKIPPSKQP